MPPANTKTHLPMEMRDLLLELTVLHGCEKAAAEPCQLLRVANSSQNTMGVGPGKDFVAHLMEGADKILRAIELR